VAKAVVIVRGLDIDYGMPEGERNNLKITLELTNHLVSICEELIAAGATHIMLVGTEKQEEAAILVSYFPNITFDYCNLHEAYALLLHVLAPSWTHGEFTLTSNFGIAYCEICSDSGFDMYSYLIRHGVKSTSEEAGLGCVSTGRGHEEYILEMIKHITRFQKHGISVFNTAVIIPEDNHVWRVLLQAVARERMTNIGAYILDREIMLRTLLNL
jgi:hypothetical protein